MRDRSTAVQTIEGKSSVAQTVSTSGVSESTRRNNPTAVAFIRHLVIHTPPDAYAAACEALAGSGSGWEPSKIICPVHILGGDADYMAGPSVIEGWAKDLKQGTSSVMPGIGHWGGIEAPHQVAEALAAFVGE
jgi:pimeloyl-ACP methyl ester carboxylesterase